MVGYLKQSVRHGTYLTCVLMPLLTTLGLFPFPAIAIVDVAMSLAIDVGADSSGG